MYYRRSLLILFVYLLTSSCQSIVERTYPQIQSTDFSGKQNGRVLVRIWPLPTERGFSRIDNIIKSTLGLTKAFTLVEVEKILDPPPSWKFVKNEDQYVDQALGLMYSPSDNFDWTLDVIVLTRRFHEHFGDALLGGLTLGIYPPKVDLEYFVAVRLRKKNEIKQIKKFEEAYTVKGLWFKLDREPIGNVIALAVKDYQQDGILK